MESKFLIELNGSLEYVKLQNSSRIFLQGFWNGLNVKGRIHHQKIYPLKDKVNWIMEMVKLCDKATWHLDQI